MNLKNKQKKVDIDDAVLRLATARSSDAAGQAIFPITANATAEEEIVEPEKTRNLDLDSGA